MVASFANIFSQSVNFLFTDWEKTNQNKSVLFMDSFAVQKLGHKESLGKFKKIEIISSIFSNHNTMRLEINYKKKTAKNTNMWRLNYMLLNN